MNRSNIPRPHGRNLWAPADADLQIIDQFIDEQRQQAAQLQALARGPLPKPPPMPRLAHQPYEGIELPPREFVDAFIRVMLFYRCGGGQDGDYPLTAALQALPWENVDDRIGRFLQYIWIYLDPDSRAIVSNLPATWVIISEHWRQLSTPQRQAGTHFYKPIFNRYEEMLHRYVLLRDSKAPPPSGASVSTMLDGRS